MQLKHFVIRGLFGHLNHSIPFPVPGDMSNAPALVVLHGPNGVGKTTILRMLDGMVRLDFNPFRRVPFETCDLEFDSGQRLQVASRNAAKKPHLEVSFGDLRARLDMSQSGPLEPKDASDVELFRKTFLESTEGVHFEFIDTERLYRLTPHQRAIPPAPQFMETPEGLWLMDRPSNPKSRPAQEHQTLALRVKRFIRDAQVNYRTFFSSTEPDLFPKIIERLTSGQAPKYNIASLRKRLTEIHEQDVRTARFGLEPDRWDFDQMMTQLKILRRETPPRRQQALTVLGPYVELLESRAAERALVADRLLTFESLMNSFFLDKRVTIESREGIQIAANSGQTLNESQLSSGEFHLLFLMVAALTTRRLGTIIAVDEPEMSMHLAWQRMLLPALLKCASSAEPLFIFATHSPDFAAAYPDAMIELG